MAWDAEANELYPHTVTLQEPGDLNIYGRKRENGPPSIEREAHVEWKMRQVRDVKGQTTMSSVAVYLRGDPRCDGTSDESGVLLIDPEWIVTLPNDVKRPILSVDRFADEDGDLHEVLYLQ